MNKKPKKIGYIVSLFPCWSETFILNEIIELSNNGYDICIFSIRKDFEKYTQEKAKAYLAVCKYINGLVAFFSFLKWLIMKPHVIIPWALKIKVGSLRNPKIFFKNVWCIFVACYFASIAQDEGIKHLHAHFATYPSLVALIMSKLTGVDYTITTHAHDIFLDKTLLKEKVEHAKAVATISEYNKKYMADYCGKEVLEKISVIHCGLDLSEWTFSPADSDPTTNNIVCVGRLTEMKGFEYLIEACHLIGDRIDFQCHIVGDGHLKGKFEKLIKKYDLKHKIILEGILDSAQVRELMQKTNVFVVPSVWNDKDGQDGIPLVLMEALAIGTPSIATTVSGIPELVSDGETGFLVEPKNVQQLADKIVDLVKNKDLQQHFAMEGRLKIEEEFNISKNARLLAQLF